MTTLKDANGHAVSGATPTALDHLETALHQFRCLSGDPVASVDAALRGRLLGPVLGAVVRVGDTPATRTGVPFNRNATSVIPKPAAFSPFEVLHVAARCGVKRATHPWAFAHSPCKS